MVDPRLGRYSFVVADPFEVIRVEKRSRRETASDENDAMGALQSSLSRFSSDAVPGLPPFQGGAVGLLGYELGGQFESLPSPVHDEFSFPDAIFGLYDVVVAFDHQLDRGWIVSQGFPETEPGQRHRRANRRMQQFLAWLTSDKVSSTISHDSGDSLRMAAPITLTSPAIATPYDRVTSNFSEQTYCAAVKRAVDYIRAGDVFQVNLAQRLVTRANESAGNLYGRLRERSPATFAGYFDGGDFQIVSASPERFIKVVQGRVETRPIKGTRPTSDRPEADMYSGEVLKMDEKERAENVMIVDLMRNDLSRVCRPDSVRVTQLCRLEQYGYVQHLVSAVEGQLRDRVSVFDLIRAAFPGGSITGAPKIRAMEIITELEKTARGAYCGSLGYIGWSGDVDFSILIRTITVAGGWLQMPVGGGVTVRSNPRREYLETWHKAAGMLKALE